MAVGKYENIDQNTALLTDDAINHLHHGTKYHKQWTKTSYHLQNPLLLLFLHHLLCFISEPPSDVSLVENSYFDFPVRVIQHSSFDTIVKSTPVMDYVHKNFDLILSENGARIVRKGYFATSPSLRESNGLYRFEMFILETIGGYHFGNSPEDILRPFASTSFID